MIVIFFLGQKLLHVLEKASIPFKRLSRRLNLPTCIRKFCHAIFNSTKLEKRLLKYAAVRGRTLSGFLIKKKVRDFKAYFLAWQAALKSFWVRIMVFSEKMVCIHNSDDEKAVIRMGTV